jgi:hypothetical protein
MIKYILIVLVHMDSIIPISGGVKNLRWVAV